MLGEQLAHGADRRRRAGEHRIATARVAGGVVQDVADALGPVAGEQLHPGAERARHARRQQARARDDVEAQVTHRRDARRPGRRALPAHDERAARLRVEGDDRDLAAEAVEVRLDDLQHEPGGGRRVKRVAALLQDRHPRGGGQPVGGGHHPEAAGQLLAIGERHRHEPLVKVQLSGLGIICFVYLSAAVTRIPLPSLAMHELTHDADARSGIVLAVASAASFGLSGALASGLFATGWSAGAVVLVRLGLGALVLAPFAIAALRGRWAALRRHAGLVALYGAVPMALAQFAYFSAVDRMAVGPALLIEYTAPATVVGWLWLRRGERPTSMTLAGAAVCAVGLVLVLDLIAGPSLDALGVGWALLAMVGAATYFVLGSDAIAAVPAVGLAGGGLVTATLGLGLLGAIGVLPLHATTASPSYGGLSVAWWLPLLALGTVTCGLAYCTGVAAIRRLGSRVASFVGLLEVVSGVVWAWLLLTQVPSTLQLAGGVLLLTGIVVVRLGERALPPADREPVLRVDRGRPHRRDGHPEFARHRDDIR